jgi:hypothetical protein
MLIVSLHPCASFSWGLPPQFVHMLPTLKDPSSHMHAWQMIPAVLHHTVHVFAVLCASPNKLQVAVEQLRVPMHGCCTVVTGYFPLL